MRSVVRSSPQAPDDPRSSLKARAAQLRSECARLADLLVAIQGKELVKDHVALISAESAMNARDLAEVERELARLPRTAARSRSPACLPRVKLWLAAGAEASSVSHSTRSIDLQSTKHAPVLGLFPHTTEAVAPARQPSRSAPSFGLASLSYAAQEMETQRALPPLSLGLPGSARPLSGKCRAGHGDPSLNPPLSQRSGGWMSVRAVSPHHSALGALCETVTPSLALPSLRSQQLPPPRPFSRGDSAGRSSSSKCSLRTPSPSRTPSLVARQERVVPCVLVPETPARHAALECPGGDTSVVVLAPQGGPCAAVLEDAVGLRDFDLSPQTFASDDDESGGSPSLEHLARETPSPCHADAGSGVQAEAAGSRTSHGGQFSGAWCGDEAAASRTPPAAVEGRLRLLGDGARPAAASARGSSRSSRVSIRSRSPALLPFVLPVGAPAPPEDSSPLEDPRGGLIGLMGFCPSPAPPPADARSGYPRTCLEAPGLSARPASATVYSASLRAAATSQLLRPFPVPSAACNAGISATSEEGVWEGASPKARSLELPWEQQQRRRRPVSAAATVAVADTPSRRPVSGPQTPIAAAAAPPAPTCAAVPNPHGGTGVEGACSQTEFAAEVGALAEAADAATANEGLGARSAVGPSMQSRTAQRSVAFACRETVLWRGVWIPAGAEPESGCGGGRGLPS